MQCEKSEYRKNFASIRSQVYVILSRGFWYPDHPGHQEISFSSPSFWDGFSQLINRIDADEELQEYSHQWRMAALREPEENEVSSRSEEYTRLFAHIKTVKAPPHETEYGSDHIFMKTHQLADINGFYHAFGMTLDKQISERPDHLSVECEFMALLTLKEAYALEAVHEAEGCEPCEAISAEQSEHGEREKADITLDAQRKFLEEHLGRWAPFFSEIVIKETRLSFYKTASAFLKAFLQWDAKWLGISPKPIDKPLLNVDNLPL